MKKAVIFLMAVITVCFSGVPALAYSRNADAAVYADFNVADRELTGTGESVSADTVTYFNGMHPDTKASVADGALKIEFSREGHVVFGQDFVDIRDTSGKLNYQYLVMRIKGEAGNENRTATGGLLLFIGGKDGDHAITLNDRPTGAAPCAVDANGQPMNAISTEWQTFAVKLSDTNVYNEAGCGGLNINSVSVAATLYIDDIYFTNTAPADAAVYDPSTSTSNVASQPEDSTADTDSSVGEEQSDTASDTSSDEQTDASVGGTVIDGTDAERLDPPVREQEKAAEESGGNIWGIAALIVSAVLLAAFAAVLAVIYFTVIRKN